MVEKICKDGPNKQRSQDADKAYKQRSDDDDKTYLNHKKKKSKGCMTTSLIWIMKR